MSVDDSFMSAPFSLEQMVKVTSGEVLNKGEELFSGFSTDTRADAEGRVFIALKGESFDAHDFLSQAIQSKATGLIVHDRAAAEKLIEELSSATTAFSKKVTVILVNDTLRAFQQLGLFWREMLPTKILGITGSNGKTTTKEFLRQMLSSEFKTYAPQKSLNNHWGVPMAMLSIKAEHEVAVLEMGMNHLGELTELCKISKPDIVGVTFVGCSHLEGLGSVDGVAKGKREIYEASPPSSIKIFNLSNPYTLKMYQDFSLEVPRENIFTFASLAEGDSSEGEGVSADVAMKLVASSFGELQIEGQIKGVQGKAAVKVFGEHNVENVMAASAFCLALGIKPEKIWELIPLCQTSWGRNQILEHSTGAKILFDGYNSNPESAKALFSSLKNIFEEKSGDQGRNEEANSGDSNGATDANSGSEGRSKNFGRKIAILGEMKELGFETANFHRWLGEECARLNFDQVWFVGESGAAFQAGIENLKFKNNLMITESYEDELASRIASVLEPQDIVVIKGSRGVGLEKVLGCWGLQEHSFSQ